MQDAIFSAPALPDGRAMGFDLVDIASLLWRRKWLLAGAALVAGGLGVGVATKLPKIYVASGAVVVRADAAVAPDSDRSYYATAVNDAVVTTERDVMVADGLLTQVAHAVTFPPAVQATVDRAGNQAAREARRIQVVRNALATTASKDSSVITVRASTIDPAFSAAIVNHLLDDYMTDRTAAQHSTADNVAVSLDRQLARTDAAINAAETRIDALMQRPGMVEREDVPGDRSELTLTGEQLQAARAELARRQAAYGSSRALEHEAGGDPAQLAALLDTNSLSGSDLRRQYALAEQNYADLSANEGPDHPRVVSARHQLASLGRSLASEAGRIVSQQRQDVAAEQQVVNTLGARYDALRQHQVGDTGATLDLARERDLLASLRHQSGVIQDHLIAVEAQPVDPNARILTRAAPPARAAFPSRLMFGALGAILGLVLAASLVLLFGFRKRLKPTAAEHAALLDGPLLGAIPRFRLPGRTCRGLATPADWSRSRAFAPVGTAFQATALELEHALMRIGGQLLTVTSAVPNEGKSTVALAIGRELALAGRRVLLIGCDLHGNRAAYVAGERDGPRPYPFEDVTVDAETGLHLLLPEAERTPLAFLRSERFSDMLDYARGDYDVVLCDTPPVLSVPDALQVIRLCDAVAIVSQEHTDRATLAELARRVQATGKPVAGVVVSKATRASASAGGYGLYSGYRPTGRALVAERGR